MFVELWQQYRYLLSVCVWGGGRGLHVQVYFIFRAVPKQQKRPCYCSSGRHSRYSSSAIAMSVLSLLVASLCVCVCVCVCVCGGGGALFFAHAGEIVFLICGCIAAQLTRKLVLEWPEFKYILVAFANAAVIKGLIAVFYFTLMPNKYPDYIYLLQFFDNMFTITSAVLVIFGHKVRASGSECDCVQSTRDKSCTLVLEANCVTYRMRVTYIFMYTIVISDWCVFCR